MFHFLKRFFHNIPKIIVSIIFRTGGNKLNKIVGVSILLLVFGSILCGTVAAVVSPGPAPDSGDGIPSGNQFIQPDSPGIGPAPNSGDGIPDGSGF